MNRTIYTMELKRHFKSFAIWTLSICGILFFGMMFYPAISADGLLLQMEAMFENPMMKGMLSAFGADVYSMSSLTGFYVTYNSIYNVLLGCIFAAILAGNLLAKEESDKTAEFLYTRPVSRTSVFFSKSAVLFTYITLLAISYFATSLISMEVVKTDAPDQIILSNRSKQLIIRQVKQYPDRIYNAFNLTHESFGHYSLQYASGLLSQSQGEIEEMNLEADVLNQLIAEAQSGPEDFFTRVLENPDPYMTIFSFPPEQREDFLANVRMEQEEFQTMKTQFFQSPDLFLMFFDADPHPFLEQFLNDKNSLNNMINTLDLPEEFGNTIIGKYQISHLCIMSIYIYLLILAIGFLILFLSLLMKRGQSVLGAALGLVFIFYFINTITSAVSVVASKASLIGYISPFTWMDFDYSSPGYALVWWRVLLFLGLASLSTLSALRIFQKKDILI